MAEPYSPIDCNFYDRLEAAATLKKDVVLEFRQGQKIETRHTIIKTIMLKDKIEWLVLSDGAEIRLDRIYSLDGVKLASYC